MLEGGEGVERLLVCRLAILAMRYGDAKLVAGVVCKALEGEDDVIALFLENKNYKSAIAIKDVNGINRIIKVVKNDD